MKQKGNKHKLNVNQKAQPQSTAKKAKKKLLGNLKTPNQNKNKNANKTNKNNKKISIKDNRKKDNVKKKNKLIGSYLDPSEKEFRNDTSNPINKDNKKDSREDFNRFRWIRREIEGFHPLYSLGIWDKIWVTRRYLDEKSGKTAKKLALKKRKEEEMKLNIESKLKREITEFTEQIIEGEINQFQIEIAIEPDYINCLENVLDNDYFAMFNVKQKIPNPNYKVYEIFPPIILTFSKKNIIDNI